MPKPRGQAREPGANASRGRVDDRRSGAIAERSGVADGITITRWSLALSLTIALAVVTGAFTLVWEQMTNLGETQKQLVAAVAGLDARTTGLDARITGLETRMIGLESEMREMRGEIRELADLIRAREPGVPPTQ